MGLFKVHWPPIQKEKIIRIEDRIVSARSFLLPKLHRVAEFLVSQGIATAGNLLFGFLCIRLLPVEDYAKFVVVFSIQASLTILLDIGISGTFVPLVGERIDDLPLIADYLASLRQIAYWLFAVAAPIVVFAFPQLVRNRHWSAPTIAAMVALVLISAWFARVAAAYGAVLILRRDRARWYQAQMGTSFGALALLGVCVLFHCFGVFVAIAIGVAKTVVTAGIYFARAQKLLGVRGAPSSEKRAAIVHLALPAVPSVMYYALGGQISVFLITYFGRTSAVASVGALSRLGQIFALVQPINGILIEPYFARLPKEKLKSHYPMVVFAASACSAALVVLARIFPGLFLWVLGPKYAGLRDEVVLTMLSGALGFVAGAMASINGARLFTYYTSVLADIVLTLILQAIYIWKVDLSTVQAVLWFNIFTMFPTTGIAIVTAFYGFTHGGRRIPESGCSPAAAEGRNG